MNDEQQATYPIQKSEAEWKEELSEQEFYILRERGTEPAGSGDLLENKKDGMYLCAGCGHELFSSGTKFSSGTGWPSFWKPVSEEAIRELPDHRGGMVRTEVVCNRCGGHLGHVFEDGPEPTGRRYCINSISLRFEESK